MKLSNTVSRFSHQAKRGTAIQFKPNEAGSTTLKQIPAPRSTSSRYLADFNEKRARERRDAVSQYYRDHDITMASKKDSVRLSAAALLYTGKMHVDETDFLVGSNFTLYRFHPNPFLPSFNFTLTRFHPNPFLPAPNLLLVQFYPFQTQPCSILTRIYGNTKKSLTILPQLFYRGG
jgi:hypothetical protein